MNRLWTATAKTLAGSTIWSQTYSYDQWGNWTCSGSGLCPSLTWNSQNNQLLTIGNYSFSYDAAGNMTQDPSNYPAQPVHTYQWDAEGRVASVDGGSTWSFTYNALGHRVQWAYSGGADQHFFDPEGNWLGNAGEYTLVRFGERILALYEGSQTYFNHVNALGSTSMFTNQTGGAQEDMLFYPWGDVWKSWGNGSYNFAYLPYRDLSTTTDITTARFSSPNFGRWLSPDPLGGDLEDPQTLNKYAYVRNNPTSLTDPTGLDFYLTCTSTNDNAQTCHQVNNGGQNVWVQGTTTNGQFNATVISNGANGTLVDQNGNQYTGTFSRNGVSFTSDNGNGVTSNGVFENGSDPTKLSGSGLFQGFTGVFNDNCGGTCIASGSIFGTAAQFDALRDQLLRNPGLDPLDIFHLGSTQYRGGNPSGPDPHLVDKAKTQARGFDQFHYDSSYPYATVPGFFGHTWSALRSIGHLITGPSQLPPPEQVP